MYYDSGNSSLLIIIHQGRGAVSSKNWFRSNMYRDATVLLNLLFVPNQGLFSEYTESEVLHRTKVYFVALYIHCI